VTDGRTDGQNYDSQDRASIAASRGKNGGKQHVKISLLPVGVTFRHYGEILQIIIPFGVTV